MVNRPASLSIKSKIIIVSLFLSLTTLFAISMLSYVTADRLIEDRVHSQLASESSGRGTAISLLRDSRIHQIELFASNQQVQDVIARVLLASPAQGELEAFQQEFSSEVQKFRAVSEDSFELRDVTLARPDGTILIASDILNVSGTRQGQITEWTARAGGGASFLEFAPVEGVRSAVVGVPLDLQDAAAAGEIDVIMIAAVDVEAFDEILLNREGLGDTGEVYLVDEDRKMVSESRFVTDAPFRQVVDTFAVRECLEFNAEVSAVYTDYRNAAIVGSSYCAREEGFVLLAEIDRAEILQPVVSLRNAILGTAAAITGIVVVTALLVSNTISKPLTRLRDAVDRISRGDYEYEIEVNSSDEVGQLARQFDEMRRSVLQTNMNLNKIVRERTKELSDMTNALDATAIVAVTDKDGTITKVNKRFVEISKYSEEELIGQNHRILKSGQHSPEYFEKMWNTISTGKIFEGEIKNRAKDGSYYWVKTTIVPFLDENSQPKQYIAIHNDVTDLKNVEEKLQQALDRERENAEIIRAQSEELKTAYLELQNRDRLKDAFLSMASHELKTPLTPILGWCGALKSEKILGPITSQQRSAVDTIEKNAIKLEKLISDMLDVQKLELNELRFNMGHASVDRILRNIENDFKFVMREKNIKFTITAEPNLELISDEARISQVLAALLYNSVDFVPKETGVIEVSAQSKGDDILFCVKDNGPGIPEHKKKFLFQKFYQVDTSLKRKHGGTGLGLAISKGIVTGLGGKIWVETKEGIGSSFYFSLPKGEGSKK